MSQRCSRRSWSCEQPFCLTMLNDASKADAGEVKVFNEGELAAGRLKWITFIAERL